MLKIAVAGIIFGLVLIVAGGTLVVTGTRPSQRFADPRDSPFGPLKFLPAAGD